MVAYNFQKQFVEPIRDGRKRQTIRRIGKRRHAKAGDMLQLYTGQRTRSCEKIIDDQRCLDVTAITIRVSEEWFSVKVGDEWLKDLQTFARADGFEGAAEFHAFWLEFHGTGEAHHLLIRWGPDDGEIV